MILTDAKVSYRENYESNREYDNLAINRSVCESMDVNDSIIINQKPTQSQLTAVGHKGLKSIGKSKWERFIIRTKFVNYNIYFFLSIVLIMGNTFKIILKVVCKKLRRHLESFVHEAQPEENYEKAP